MPEPRNRGRELRALWATLAVVCLLAAGVAYGATRYLQSELEADATQDARKLTNEVLEPLLSDKDAAGPVRGARYGELLASLRERVLAGPITGLRLWAQDGDRVLRRPAGGGWRRDAGTRRAATIAGSSTSVVEDGEFRTTTSMRVGDPDDRRGRADPLARDVVRSGVSQWPRRPLAAAGSSGGSGS